MVIAMRQEKGFFDFDMKSVWQQDAEDTENAEKKAATMERHSGMMLCL